MALSDAEAQAKIDQMVAFIEQDVNEKVKAIDEKAEEEFNSEKSQLIQDQRHRIIEYYDKKEKQVVLRRKIQGSHVLNQARLKVLKAREDYIKIVLDEAREQLHSRTKDSVYYQEVLRTLILQAVFQLLESEVTVRCRKQDVDFVAKSLDSVSKEFLERIGKPIKIKINKDNYLPPDCAGGIELLAQQDRMRINNTLESRLDMISQQLLPEIRETLFGANPNRKFRD